MSAGDRIKIGPFEAVKFFGDDPMTGEWTPYMEKWGIHIPFLGSFWVHHFLRGDADRDHHDHPWPFWTFPLTTYVEEVSVGIGAWDGEPHRVVYSHLVRAGRLHYRPATYCHRVVGPWSGGEDVCRCGSTEWGQGWPCSTGGCLFEPQATEGGIWTLVFHRPKVRKWGFWKHRDGLWCWDDWKKYAHGGGKSAPCATVEPEKDQ